jgi:hypothetical protein
MVRSPHEALQLVEIGAVCTQPALAVAARVELADFKPTHTRTIIARLDRANTLRGLAGKRRREIAILTEKEQGNRSPTQAAFEN